MTQFISTFLIIVLASSRLGECSVGSLAKGNIENLANAIISKINLSYDGIDRSFNDFDTNTHYEEYDKLKNINVQNAKIIIPEFPVDSLDMNMTLNLSNSSLSSLAKGIINLCDGNVWGLKSIVEDLTAGADEENYPDLLIVTFSINVGNASLTSDSSAMSILLMDLIHLTSYGSFELSAQNAVLELKLFLGLIDNGDENPQKFPFNLTNIEISLGATQFSIYSDDATMNGIVGWEAIIKTIADLLALLYPSLKMLLLSVLKPVFMRCTFADFLGGGFDCLGLGGLISLPIEIIDSLECSTRPQLPTTTTTTTTAKPKTNGGSFYEPQQYLLFSILLIFIITRYVFRR